MELNRHLEKALENLTPEKRKALLLWFSLGQDTLQTKSETLNSILGELDELDVESCYELLQSVTEDDQVRMALVQEFGENKADTLMKNTPVVSAIKAKLHEQQMNVG